MYKCGQNVIDLFHKNYRQVIRITFSGKYESFTITESDILQGGLTIDRYCVSGTKLELGSAIAAELTLKLKNYDGKYDTATFEGAELFVEIGVKKWDAHRWEKAVTEYIPCGYFIVDTPPRAKSAINISALDRMVLLDKEADLTAFEFPMTVKSFVEKICEVCEISLAADLTKLVNSEYIITSAPTSVLTYRTLIQQCAFVMGTCAFMNHDGELVFKWYEQTDFPVTPSERYSSDMYENDITITGIVYTGGDGKTYVVGDTCYTLTYGSCDILQTDIEEALRNIYYSVRGFTYRPYEAVIKSSPFLYPLDMIKYTDAKGVVHDTVITHATFTANNNTSIAGSGETSTSNDYVSNSGLTAQQTQAIQEMKNSIAVTISSQELEGFDLSQIIANSMGYNLTVMTAEDGTKSFYIHNASTVAASNVIYTLRNGQIAFTDNFNSGRWTNVITQENNAVMEIIGRYKLGGSCIENGSITKAHLSNSYLNENELAIASAQSAAVSTSKAYAESEIDSLRNDTVTQLAQKAAVSELNTAVSEVTDYIDRLARLIFIEGSDGKEYSGKLRVIGGKPFYEYEEVD